jgi:hypothetical protein
MPSATGSRDAVSFRRAGARSVVPRWRSLAEILRPNGVLHTIHASQNVQARTENIRRKPAAATMDYIITSRRHRGALHGRHRGLATAHNCTQSVCVDGRWKPTSSISGSALLGNSARKRDLSRAVRISTSAGERHDRRDRCRSPQLLRARLHPALASNKAASLKPVMTDQFGDYRQGVRGDTSR